MKKFYFLMIFILVSTGYLSDAQAAPDNDNKREGPSVGVYEHGHEEAHASVAAASPPHEVSHQAPAPHEAAHTAPAKPASQAHHEVSRQTGGPWRWHNETQSHQANFTHRHLQRHVGTRRHHLPPSYRRISFLNRIYFYDDGFFYLDNSDGYYDIVQPPVGAVIPELPAAARQVVVRGIIYYEYEGVYYQPVAGGFQVVLQPY